MYCQLAFSCIVQKRFEESAIVVAIRGEEKERVGERRQRRREERREDRGEKGRREGKKRRRGRNEKFE